MAALESITVYYMYIQTVEEQVPTAKGGSTGIRKLFSNLASIRRKSKIALADEDICEGEEEEG